MTQVWWPPARWEFPNHTMHCLKSLIGEGRRPFSQTSANLVPSWILGFHGEAKAGMEKGPQQRAAGLTQGGWAPLRLGCLHGQVARGLRLCSPAAAPPSSLPPRFLPSLPSLSSSLAPFSPPFVLSFWPSFPSWRPPFLPLSSLLSTLLPPCSFAVLCLPASSPSDFPVPQTRPPSWTSAVNSTLGHRVITDQSKSSATNDSARRDGPQGLRSHRSPAPASSQGQLPGKATCSQPQEGDVT